MAVEIHPAYPMWSAASDKLRAALDRNEQALTSGSVMDKHLAAEEVQRAFREYEKACKAIDADDEQDED